MTAQSFTPSEAQFSISKVKLKKDGVVDLHYEVTETVGQETYTNKYHLESAKDVHPDMRQLFKSLNTIVARIFKFTSFQSVVSAPDFKATAKQREAADTYADEVTKGVHVSGLSYSGTGDNVKVVLTALYTVANNQKVAINTPAIRIEGESWGFEEELADIASQIEGEVYQFLFHGKKAQLEIFGQGDTDKDEDIFGSLFSGSEDKETEGDE